MACLTIVTGWKDTLEKRALGFDEYLAGGFLANAPLLFFTYVAKSLWSEGPPAIGLEIPSMVAVALGGIAAGYLVVRRVKRDHFRTGLKVGVSSFIVNFALSSIVLGGASILYGVWILFLFCCAAVIGSYLTKITSKEADLAS